MTDVKPTSIIEGAIDQDETERVGDAYFDAIARRDVDAAVALWRTGGRENVRGQVDTTAPEGVREFLSGLFGPFPDLAFEVVEKTIQDDRGSYRWKATGTFDIHGIIHAAEAVLGQPVPYTVSPRRPGDPAELVAAVAKARRVLNWQAGNSDLDQVISSAWNWYVKDRGRT